MAEKIETITTRVSNDSSLSRTGGDYDDSTQPEKADVFHIRTISNGGIIMSEKKDIKNMNIDELETALVERKAMLSHHKFTNEFEFYWRNRKQRTLNELQANIDAIAGRIKTLN